MTLIASGFIVDTHSDPIGGMVVGCGCLAMLTPCLAVMLLVYHARAYLSSPKRSVSVRNNLCLVKLGIIEDATPFFFVVSIVSLVESVHFSPVVFVQVPYGSRKCDVNGYE